MTGPQEETGEEHSEQIGHASAFDSHPCGGYSGLHLL